MANFLGPVSTSKPASSSFIVLSHDIHNDTVQTLVPFMISNAKKYGYQFATVGECMNDPPQNWYRDATNGSTISNALGIVNKLAGNSTGGSVPTGTANESAFGSQTTPTTSAQASSKASTKSNAAVPITPVSPFSLLSLLSFGMLLLI